MMGPQCGGVGRTGASLFAALAQRVRSAFTQAAEAYVRGNAVALGR
jgi:hypothetical protein